MRKLQQQNIIYLLLLQQDNVVISSTKFRHTSNFLHNLARPGTTFLHLILVSTYQKEVLRHTFYFDCFDFEGFFGLSISFFSNLAFSLACLLASFSAFAAKAFIFFSAAASALSCFFLKASSFLCSAFSFFPMLTM